MSITFFPVDENGRRFPYITSTRPCIHCKRGICQPGWCDNGVETVERPSVPECNFSNDNATMLMATLGLVNAVGELQPHEVSQILDTCDAGLRDDADGLLVRAPLLRETREVTPRLMSFGSDDQQAKRRLSEMREVLQHAKDHNVGVRWA